MQVRPCQRILLKADGDDVCCMRVDRENHRDLSCAHQGPGHNQVDLVQPGGTVPEGR